MTDVKKAVASASGKKKQTVRKKTSVARKTAKKVASKKVTSKKAVSKKATVKKTTRKAKKAGMTPEERYRLIAEAAFLRAESRGFVGGDPVEDWLAAEKEVDDALTG